MEKSNDSLAPKTGRKGITGQLHTVTLCTQNIDAIESFYVGGLGMEMEGPIDLSTALKEKQRALWGISDTIDYDFYHLSRPSVKGLVHIRVLHILSDVPSIHNSYDSRELGPFSLGFPNGDQKSLDLSLREKGIRAMAPMQGGEIPRPDGTTYPYWETIFKGPDYLHVVGIERGGGMPPLAPIDTKTNLGGPGYSAQVIKSSDHELAFYTDVLGLELRADRHWITSPGSALGIGEGVPYRFSLIYAYGSSHNHLLFLDYEDGIYTDTGVTPRVPNLGLGMWTFPTSDLDIIMNNARSFGSEVIQNRSSMECPILGKVECGSLLAPNGFLIELYETS